MNGSVFGDRGGGSPSFLANAEISLAVQLKVIGSGVLLTCYMMMFASAASNESAERSKLAQQKAEQQRQTEREQTAQYLKSNKAAIQAEANAFIEQGKVAEGKRLPNTPCISQAGTHWCGSNWPISLARCAGNRVSTSLR